MVACPTCPGEGVSLPPPLRFSEAARNAESEDVVRHVTATHPRVSPHFVRMPVFNEMILDT